MIKSEQILQEVVEMIDGIEVDSVQVPAFRSRVAAFSKGEVPAIIVLPVQDVPSTPDLSTLDWSLTIRIAIYTRGYVPDSAASAIRGAIHEVLHDDMSLGGLVMDIVPGPVSFDFDPTDNEAGATLLSYVFKYRTTQESLV